MLSRFDVISDYRRREILLLGIVREWKWKWKWKWKREKRNGIPEEEPAAQDVGTARSEEVTGVEIVDF